MKSSNLRHHADELLATLHALALSLDDLESALSTACTLLVYNERDHSGRVTREALNVQVGASDRTHRARERNYGYAMEVEQMDRSITYTEQIANKKIIGEQGLTINGLRAEVLGIQEIRRSLEEASKAMESKIARL